MQTFIFFLIVFSSCYQIFSLNINSHENEAYFEEDNMVKRSMFPDDFIFGAGTSAYQIEGAYLEDGKSLNNWDVFSRVSGYIANGANASVADDYYHRYMEDIENLESLGVDAYRFSISWSRLLPRGRFGEVNPLGVAFYNKIIDNILLKGIEPFVTIYHEDMPQELEDRYGSWLNSLIQEDFAHFAKTCFEEFGDRVRYWSTINEPNLSSYMAYMKGMFPPGYCSPPFGNCSIGNSDVQPLIAGHNKLLAHAKAVKLYREKFQPKQGGFIGISVQAFNYEPYRDDEYSRRAMERAFAYNVAWMLDPLIYGDYPSLMRKYHGKELPVFSKEEVELVKGSLDFIGINHYGTKYAIDCFHYSADCTPQDNRAIQGFVSLKGYRDDIPIEDQTTNGKYSILPQGMEKVVDYLSMRYPNTNIYVTENGYSPPRITNVTDMLHDVKRVKYHQEYLKYLAKATRKGAKVKGYFAWTLMDCFEWLSGYNASYGLFYVDRTTLKRTPKLSAKWYAEFLAEKSPKDKNIRSITNSLEGHVPEWPKVVTTVATSFHVEKAEI